MRDCIIRQLHQYGAGRPQCPILYSPSPFMLREAVALMPLLLTLIPTFVHRVKSMCCCNAAHNEICISCVCDLEFWSQLLLLLLIANADTIWSPSVVFRGYSNGGYSYPVLPQYGSYNPYGTVDRRQFAGTLPRDGLYNYDPYRRWPYVSSKGQLDHSPRIFSHFQSKIFHYRLFKMGFLTMIGKKGSFKVST